jgi:hypothetical protein
LKAIVDAERSDVFTEEMLSAISQTLAEFANLAKEDFVVFLEPPLVSGISGISPLRSPVTVMNAQ